VCTALVLCCPATHARAWFGRGRRFAPVASRLRGGSDPPDSAGELEAAGARDDDDGYEGDEATPPLEEFDLVVIGGGSGGLACAQEAARHGKTVAVCDFVSPSPAGTSWGLGGTCVNVGCIPKKLMHHAALLGGSLSDAASFGWELGASAPSHSWQTMVRNVQMHIKSLNFGYKAALMSADVEYVNARAAFHDPHTVHATEADGTVRRLRAKHFVIAVGGRPRYLDHIPGGRELVISSDDLFSLPRPPGKTLCIGGGYVSLECAGFIAGLGMEPHVMVRSVPLRGFDRQMAQLVKAHMEGELGVRFVQRALPTRIERVERGPTASARTQPGGGEDGEDDELPEAAPSAEAAAEPTSALRVTWTVTLPDGTRVQESGEYDTVLVAIGRDASTAQLGLDRLGVGKVELNARTGKIRTARGEQTGADHVFAIGDVLDGKPELTPVAIQAGRLLARRLYAGSEVEMEYDGVPTTVFTPLEYACVGMSEEQAIEQLGKVRARSLAPARPSHARLSPGACSQRTPTRARFTLPFLLAAGSICPRLPSPRLGVHGAGARGGVPLVLQAPRVDAAAPARQRVLRQAHLRPRGQAAGTRRAHVRARSG
jgi:thioredoxin reductase (NADPH)